MMDPIPEKFKDIVQDVDDFTFLTSPFGGEVRFLQFWLLAAFVDAGLVTLAQAQAVARELVRIPVESAADFPTRFLFRGLRTEHLRSKIPASPDDYTVEMAETLSQYKIAADQVITDFLTQPTTPPPPDPGNGGERTPQALNIFGQPL